MPDIQTEMKKVIQAWETPEPQPKPIEQPKGRNVFAPTNNVSQETFNFVRDNSGCSRKEVIYALVNKGHKKSSVSSLVGQMLRQGHIWRDSSGLLRPNGAQYTPIKSARTIANRAKKAIAANPAETFKLKTSKLAKKYKTKETPVPAGIAALVKEHVEKDRVQEIMNTISLPEAKRLYNALVTYFGTP